MASFQVLNGKIMGGPVIPTESLKPLWINPDPEADFGEQNITLASGDYDLLLWIIRYSHDANAYEFSVIIEKGKGGLFETAVTSTDEYVSVHQRIARYISDTEYKIFAANGQKSGSSRSTSNAYNIPVKVYGIKKNSVGGGDDHLMKYSTNEQIVGTWIDGKPIYQKTIKTKTPTTSGQISLVPVGTNIGTVVSINSMMCDGDAHWFSAEAHNASAVNQFVRVAVFANDTSANPNNLRIDCTESLWLDKDIYVTIQYTKTTD